MSEDCLTPLGDCMWTFIYCVQSSVHAYRLVTTRSRGILNATLPASIYRQTPQNAATQLQLEVIRMTSLLQDGPTVVLAFQLYACVCKRHARVYVCTEAGSSRKSDRPEIADDVCGSIQLVLRTPPKS